MIRRLLFLFLTVVFTLTGFSQQTGSFNHSLTFMGQARNLSCYVPANYNSSNQYKLVIGLHGLGDNSINYRNALIGPLDWENVFPNTIFICPDGGNDRNSDFYAPAGDEAIIDSAIAFAMQNYNIDSNFVVLQGFSLGGRSAFKYGLEHPSKFVGLFLNTPAFQGDQDILNNPLTSLMYNYGNVPQVPIYITVGDQDVIYYYTINPLINQLKKLDAKLHYESVAGLGHTVPGSNFTSPAFPFFTNPAVADFDVDLFEVDLPQRTCASNLSPVCYIQNRGDARLTSVELNYNSNGNSGSYTWNGNIGAYEHAQVPIPAINTAAGDQEFTLSIGSINGNMQDTVTSNNQLKDTVQVEDQGAPLQLTEDFEGNSPNWVFTETGTLFEWYQDTDVKKSGQASIANFNTALLFLTVGNVESFESPLLDLTSSPDPLLTFDIAFNYPKYTAAVAGIDTVFADTLEIAVSTDCGQSWQRIYKKGGAQLATDTLPMLNPLTIPACFFDPDSSQWRTDSINLSAYSSNDEAIVRFNYISGNGGSIYIDNININGKGLNIAEPEEMLVSIYPNPATDMITLNGAENSIAEAKLYDQAGNEMLSKSFSGNQAERVIDVSAVSPGFYLLQIGSGKNTVVKKLIVK